MVFRNPKVSIFFLITNTVSRIRIFLCGRAGFCKIINEHINSYATAYGEPIAYGLYALKRKSYLMIKSNPVKKS
ncbi:hypothetical protein ASF92_20615 [Pedobacter sp. Leaf176]|nr:hypothetical protein ASF92_20615 [Pedobacter sp. Leaf176]